jgi:hypothetical protein
MGHDDGHRPAPLGRLLLEDGHAEHMVDVAVGVDRRVESEFRPPAQCLMDTRRHEGRPGVDQNQSLAGGEGRHVGEGRDEGHAVGDLGQATDIAPDGVHLRDVDVAAPQLVGQLEHVVCHGPSRLATGGAILRDHFRPGPGRSDGCGAGAEPAWDP